MESVLGDVPAAARCRCATTAPAPPPATPTVDEVVADGRLPAPPKD
ncbi:MAG TPA: hypothetical protein VHO06_25895 [Polyangia bacterium]|nr:hypothetical protein [Polyangia bacterium]